MSPRRRWWFASRIISLSLAFCATATPGTDTEPTAVTLDQHLNAESDDTLAFTPDGSTVFFDRSVGTTKMILMSTKIAGHWTKPITAPFSGRWYDQNPAIAPDGSFLVFDSDRPHDTNGKPLVQGYFRKSNPGSQLWKVFHTDRGWGQPVWLGSELNDDSFIDFPSVVGDGSIYYLHMDQGEVHMFRSQYRDGHYEAGIRVAIGDAHQSTHDPAVAADESFMIVDFGRVKGGLGRLCIAFKRGSEWSTPVDLGDRVNAEMPWGPHLSADELAVYYTDTNGLWRLPLDSWRATSIR